jgi:tetratricopeptide (TPR) repeat protein
VNYYRKNRLKYYVGVCEITQKIGRIVSMILRICLPSIIGANAAFAQSPATSPAASDQQIAALIGKLSSDDPSERQSAAAALLRIGPPARPAIIAATLDDDPSLHAQATAVLINMPWYTPQDAGPVQQILKRYSSDDVGVRRSVLADLLQNPDAWPALTRLAQEDPSPTIRWILAREFRQQGGRERLRPFATLQPPANSAPLWTLRGYALLADDRPAALLALKQSADSEFRSPTEDDGEFETVIRNLTAEDFATDKYSDAEQLRRKQVERDRALGRTGMTTSLQELFVIEAYFGPLPGLDEDLKLAGSDADSAQIQYALSRMYERSGDAAKAQACAKAAYAVSKTRRQRFLVGDFLGEHQWNDLALTEYTACLEMPNDPDDPTNNLSINLHFRLGDLAARREDHLTSAQETEKALTAMADSTFVTRTNAVGQDLDVSTGVIWTEVYWQYLKAAEDRDDQAEVQKRLDQIVASDTSDQNIIIDIVPLLQKQGKTGQADAFFAKAFKEAKADLDDNPQNPEPLNNIAWLCACCDRDLDDALKWAQKAVDLAPHDWGIMDTLAEVNFHLGRFSTALQLEQQALSWAPQDPLLQRKVKLFYAATTRPASRAL